MAHAHLCVLAYLPMRLVENRAETSRSLIREMLGPLSLARAETDHASIFRVKRLKDPESWIRNSCGVEAPPRTLHATV